MYMVGDDLPDPNLCQGWDTVAAPRLQKNFASLTQGSQNLALGLIMTAALQLADETPYRPASEA